MPFSDGKEYDDYFINQISELLTHYGKIDYLWFDGCGSEGHQYDQNRILAAIRSMQPEILIFNMWDPDTRWVGNEDGYAPMPNFSSIKAVDFSVNTTEKEEMETEKFLPTECDFKMRSTWFDCEDNEDTTKEADELLGIYEMSVGRGANFLLNIGPDRNGLLPEKDTQRLREFGALLEKRYGNALMEFGPVQKETEDQWGIQITPFPPQNAGDQPVLVNRVVIEENLEMVESVEEFALYAHLPHSWGQRVCLYRGGASIGHKCICTFPTIRTGKLVLQILKKNGDAEIRNMKAYYEKV
ncbi:MAG: alpha-L-fucosidase [Clostridia bacterium]|nr:alpha-L-fucosidase [Clostridia bacterium]